MKNTDIRFGYIPSEGAEPIMLIIPTIKFVGQVYDDDYIQYEEFSFNGNEYSNCEVDSDDNTLLKVTIPNSHNWINNVLNVKLHVEYTNSNDEVVTNDNVYQLNFCRKVKTTGCSCGTLNNGLNTIILTEIPVIKGAQGAQGDIYQSYVDYALSLGIAPLSENDFIKGLGEMGEVVKNYSLVGVAIPTTIPITPKVKSCYIAATQGTYTNFNLTLNNQLGIFAYDPTATNPTWYKMMDLVISGGGSGASEINDYVIALTSMWSSSKLNNNVQALGMYNSDSYVVAGVEVVGEPTIPLAAGMTGTANGVGLEVTDDYGNDITNNQTNLTGTIAAMVKTPNTTEWESIGYMDRYITIDAYGNVTLSKLNPDTGVIEVENTQAALRGKQSVLAAEITFTSTGRIAILFSTINNLYCVVLPPEAYLLNDIDQWLYISSTLQPYSSLNEVYSQYALRTRTIGNTLVIWGLSNSVGNQYSFSISTNTLRTLQNNVNASNFTFDGYPIQYIDFDNNDYNEVYKLTTKGITKNNVLVCPINITSLKAARFEELNGYIVCSTFDNGTWYSQDGNTWEQMTGVRGGDLVKGTNSIMITRGDSLLYTNTPLSISTLTNNNLTNSYYTLCYDGDKFNYITLSTPRLIEKVKLNYGLPYLKVTNPTQTYTTDPVGVYPFVLDNGDPTPCNVSIQTSWRNIGDGLVPTKSGLLYIGADELILKSYLDYVLTQYATQTDLVNVKGQATAAQDTATEALQKAEDAKQLVEAGFTWGGAAEYGGMVLSDLPTDSIAAGATGFVFSTNTPYTFTNGVWTAGTAITPALGQEFGISKMYGNVDGAAVAGNQAKGKWVTYQETSTEAWQIQVFATGGAVIPNVDNITIYLNTNGQYAVKANSLDSETYLKADTIASADITATNVLQYGTFSLKQYIKYIYGNLLKLFTYFNQNGSANSALKVVNPLTIKTGLTYDGSAAVTIPDVTTTEKGLMTAQDKANLDALVQGGGGGGGNEVIFTTTQEAFDVARFDASNAGKFIALQKQL
jgi:hypothetical protein